MISSEELKLLLKKVVEMIMPDFDHYRRPLRKGKVIATYPSDGRYVADVEILLNNEQTDESEPIVKGVEIPVIWGGEKRGIVCPPAVGTLCDIEYYHGDPDYPRISNFRWQGNGAPDADVDELIIQQKDGVYIRITSGSDIEVKTPTNLKAEVDGNATVTVEGKTKLVCSDVEIGEETLQAVIQSERFKEYFDAHVHTGNLGAPTSPPQVPIPETVFSTEVKTGG